MLSDDGELLFHLKQQQLIELIRQGNIDMALEFAQKELASFGQHSVHTFIQHAVKRLLFLTRSPPASFPERA